MKAQFEAVYALPANLYITGSPVLIATGLLFKDMQTQQVSAQLGIQNICPKPIKAVYVLMDPFDPAGRPLGGAVSFTYLDLNAACGAVFGQTQRIPFPDFTTRSFRVRVSEVVFTDNTIWTAPDAAWAALPPQETLEERFRDPELEKQYRLVFGNGCTRFPDQMGDLWRCACGAVNKRSEPVCHRCGNTLPELVALDTAALSREKDARLSREADERQSRKKKKQMILRFGAAALVLLAAATLVLIKIVIPRSQYRQASALLERGEYSEAYEAFSELGDYKDSEVKCRLAHAEMLEDAGKTAEAAILFYQLKDVDSAYRERSLALWERAARRDSISGGLGIIAGLCTDNSVILINHSIYDSLDTSQWTDVVAVSAGRNHLVGLRSDGTVFATGDNEDGQCDVENWSDIVSVSAGGDFTIGLRADGTVSVVGDIEVSDWEDIVAVAAGTMHTVGLRSDGSVVAAGWDTFDDCNVSEWKDVVAVSAGYDHTVGLLADGTVIATGYNDNGACDVSEYGWTDIIAIAAGGAHTVGLRADGTVVATGDNEYGQCNVSGWRDIVAVYTGHLCTIGLRSDGSVVSCGVYDPRGYRVDLSWDHIKLPNRP